MRFSLKKSFSVNSTNINKSDYRRFTAINFAKPSWRTPQSMIPFIANPTKFVEKYRMARIYSPWRFLPPRNTPDLFCRRFTRQNHRCAAWAVFFFFTNKLLCSCSIFQNLFLVVDCTTSKCYSNAWKKQNVVSALRPAFFIPHLESWISRLNVIPCHDLTLSVDEPDNAAAQTGAGTSFGVNGDPITWAEPRYLFFAS